MPLSRDQILATKGRLKTREVHVPEWADGDDDVVIVRELSGEERDAFEASMRALRPVPSGPRKGEMESIPDPANTRAKLCARSIVDADGNRVFTDSDVIALGALSAAALDRVFDAAAELSGITKQAEAAAEGNSDAAPSGGSTSNEPAQPESPSVSG